MNLQAYGISGVLDTLAAADLAGLVPYFLDRALREELVVIGTLGGEPRAWTTWPLAVLEAGEARRSLARDWAGDEFDQLYLIGYSACVREAAALINRLHRELQSEGLTAVHVDRNLVVNGRQWDYAAYGEFFDDIDTESTRTVTVPHLAQGRVEGLLFRAACRKRYAAAQLCGLDPVQAAKAARIATRCRTDRAKVSNPDRQAEADEARYRSAMANPAELSLKSAVALGIAVTANAQLAADAADEITEGRPGALEVWTEVARCSIGTERATAAALAALAAWHGRDETAAAIAEIALDADPASGLAWAVWHLIGTGTAPEDVRPRATAVFAEVAA